MFLIATVWFHKYKTILIKLHLSQIKQHFNFTTFQPFNKKPYLCPCKKKSSFLTSARSSPN